ncbi:hypothetical protein K470DRAFT_259951 [Piedraia hortae CBS 480.64]|uniref:AB hydrolase-1 domain-containing protein n=1 Tax=Piedraia hortae CBS 480.64 TaxID=1314780 RepID=A0A6A7BST7_9PEZI|nr:hypothetical protein K470DRAFT_259951 [Piedraia hortae CBS 480.64]
MPPRTLLLIYIHGFHGAPSTFNTFPLDLHNSLSIPNYTIYTKLYPRFPSRRSILFARDAFMAWLTPHLTATTDVILLGHSMGGLLAAEVALTRECNVLGTVNLDVPFLGIHPGVVKAGLASVFAGKGEMEGNIVNEAGEQEGGAAGDIAQSEDMENSKPNLKDDSKEDDDPKGSSKAGSKKDELTVTMKSNENDNTQDSSPKDTHPQSPSNDDKFNPPWPNDPLAPSRAPWESVIHFVSKHSRELRSATKNLIASHLEFGGAMTKHNELGGRYISLRLLEEGEGRVEGRDGSRDASRVRFVNYYTACCCTIGGGEVGREKKGKGKEEVEVVEGEEGKEKEKEEGKEDVDVAEKAEAKGSDKKVGERSREQPEEMENEEGTEEKDQTETQTPKQEAKTPKPKDEQEQALPGTVEGSKDKLNQSAEGNEMRKDQTTPNEESTRDDNLPPTPSEEAILTPEKQTKEAEKARKAAEKLEKEKAKLEEKNRKEAEKLKEKSRKEAEKARRDKEKQDEKAQKEKLRQEKERLKQEERAQKERLKQMEKARKDSEKQEEKSRKESEKAARKASLPDGEQREKTFCLLPPTDSQGITDPTWVKVLFRDTDQVGAHCGMFLFKEDNDLERDRYERFVERVAERITIWIDEKARTDDK